jgi:hypothetical protein
MLFLRASSSLLQCKMLYVSWCRIGDKGIGHVAKALQVPVWVLFLLFSRSRLEIVWYFRCFIVADQFISTSGRFVVQ